MKPSQADRPVGYVGRHTRAWLRKQIQKNLTKAGTARAEGHQLIRIYLQRHYEEKTLRWDRKARDWRIHTITLARRIASLQAALKELE